MRRIGFSGIIKIYIFTSAVHKVKGERECGWTWKVMVAELKKERERGRKNVAI